MKFVKFVKCCSIVLILLFGTQGIDCLLLKSHPVGPAPIKRNFNQPKNGILVISFQNNGEIDNVQQLVICKQQKRQQPILDINEAGNEFSGNCLLFFLASLLFLCWKRT